MNAEVRFIDVVAGYRHPVVGPVSLELARGEAVGLVGDNGAGKSTLLALLLGEARLFAGQVQRRPGLVLRHQPQRPIRPAEAPVSGHDLLRLMGADTLAPPPRLAARLDRRVDRLSGGEYQLLCLWCALAGPADLVLLDEPTNHLDADHVDLAAEAIRARRDGHAVLLVSHDREFLQRVGARPLEVAPRPGATAEQERP